MDSMFFTQGTQLNARNLNGLNRYRGNGLNGPILATAAALLSKLKPVAKVIDSLKTFASKLNIGGVDQDRFFITYFDIRDIFVNAGYLVLGSQWHEDALTRNRIRKTQVRNNTADNYYPEFQRLRTWVIEVMDHANPGLGTDFGVVVPEFKMVTKGQIYRVYVEIIQSIVDAIPPGNYIPGTLQEVVRLESIPTGSSTPATGNNFIATLSSGAQVLKDAQGKILEIRDAAGHVLNPGSPEYQAAAKESQQKQAGFGMGYIGVGLALAFGAFMVNQGNDKKKQAA